MEPEHPARADQQSYGGCRVCWGQIVGTLGRQRHGAEESARRAASEIRRGSRFHPAHGCRRAEVRFIWIALSGLHRRPALAGPGPVSTSGKKRNRADHFQCSIGAFYLSLLAARCEPALQQWSESKLELHFLEDYSEHGEHAPRG